LSGGAPLRVGVLAVQGDFAAHAAMLGALGAEVSEVRTPEDMRELDGLVIPGGESTTITMGMKRDGLDRAVREHVERGRALLGSCAGMIVCDSAHLGLIDATAKRNAFGRQRQSFEADLEIAGIGSEPLRAVFIRAPWISGHGPGVEVLATYDDHPVVVRQGNVLACAFHPELTEDSRLHALFMAMVTTSSQLTAHSPQTEGRGTRDEGPF
jgi:5'-phosphate synthase pdxT subunit